MPKETFTLNTDEYANKHYTAEERERIARVAIDELRAYAHRRWGLRLSRAGWAVQVHMHEETSSIRLIFTRTEGGGGGGQLEMHAVYRTITRKPGIEFWVVSHSLR